MVKTLIGNINNQEVVFTLCDEGNWKAQVPVIESGTYFISLEAIDDAGNRSFFAKALYTVNAEKLEFKIEFTEYASKADALYVFNSSIADYSYAITII